MAVGTVWNGLEWFVVVVPRSRAPLVASSCLQCTPVQPNAAEGVAGGWRRPGRGGAAATFERSAAAQAVPNGVQRCFERFRMV